jgi:16S rRNA G966 N2-methylase RsmD
MKTREDLRKYLCVSAATLGNWVKTGVIPAYPNGEYFEEKTYTAIIGSITTSHNKLKKRANRLQNRSLSLHSNTSAGAPAKRMLKALSLLFEEQGANLNSFMLALCLARLRQQKLLRLRICGKQLELQAGSPAFTAFLKDWMAGCSRVAGLTEAVLSLNLPLAETGDFTGAVYEYLRPLGEKSRFGAFFTPHRLVSGVKTESGQRVLDPCAGTGSLLLAAIGKGHEPGKITLRDIDPLALKIATVNFALHFERVDKLVKTEVVDILHDTRPEDFDYVVTNPPWGARLSAEKKDFLRKKYPNLHTAESFSIALHNSLNKLSPEGSLYFILPESMLYVDAHAAIRRHVFTSGHAVSIRHFGAAFKGVMSKVVRLEMRKGRLECTVAKAGQVLDFSIKLLKKNIYRPPHIFSRKELAILEKILDSGSFYLKGKCRFGLGIVTGSNAAHLKEQRHDGAEPIFTGKEISAFKFREPRHFISPDPAKLQQVAPLELYRRPKICYRFVSNSIVTAADFDGSLILNSANFLIPDASLPIKALSAFLNAPVVTFAFRSLFNATKVLRQHLETIPIPAGFYSSAEELSRIYDEMQQTGDGWLHLHQLTCRLYGLTGEDAAFLWEKRQVI